jgi:hypothetical protein
MSTISGRTIDLMHPEKTEIILSDCCHALGKICRYGGHATRHYSVAEHSLLVGRILSEWGFGSEVVLAGYLHDAHEGIMGIDMPGPWKRVLGEAWAAHERAWEAHVRQSLGVAHVFADEHLAMQIKRADTIALATEKAAGIPHLGEWLWGIEDVEVDEGHVEMLRSNAESGPMHANCIYSSTVRIQAYAFAARLFREATGHAKDAG